MNIITKIFIKGPVVLYDVIKYQIKWLAMGFQKNFPLNAYSQKLRPWIWRLTGVNIQGRVKIGYDVYYDVGNAKDLTIEEGVWITSRCLILCHKRDLTNYYKGSDINEMPHVHLPVRICKGVHVGMGTIIMPGVTIGEGAIIGAGSLVVKDIPAWTVAVGRPAKVVRSLEDPHISTNVIEQ